MDSYTLDKLNSPHPHRSSINDLLVTAINTNNLHLLQQCIEQGADIFSNWPIGSDIIFTKAIEKGNIKILRYLTKKVKLSKYPTNAITPLIVAIRSQCSLDVVKLLVDNRCDVNELDNCGRTPLNEAIRLSKDSIIEYLIAEGAEVNRADKEGDLPLCLAVINGRHQIVKNLVMHGADVNRRDGRGDTAMILAQRTGNDRILFYLENNTKNLSFVFMDLLPESFVFLNEMGLIEAEGVVEEPATVTRWVLENDNNPAPTLEGQTAPQSLHQAVEGSLHDVSLVATKNTVDKPDAEGATPLSKAIKLGKHETVEYLLELGADSCKKSQGKTPLILAIQNNHPDIVELLLEHGAQDTVLTALQEAIIMDNLEVAKILLRTPVVLNIRYKDGSTPLIKAIERKNLDIVKEVVEGGANVNMPDGDGKQPLTACFETGNKDIFSYLLDKGATDDKEIPKILCKLIGEGNLAGIKLLTTMYEFNIDVVCGCCDCSPLTKAVEEGRSEMVEHFLNFNGDCVNKVDGKGRSALAVAAANRDFKIVKLLVSKGADLEAGAKEVEEFAEADEDFKLYLEVISGKYAKWGTS